MERRRERRLPAALPGRYQSADGATHAILYSELSTRGCRMTGAEWRLEVGDVVHLALGPLDPAAGTIVWIDGQTAGVEFREPLERAVVEFFTACLLAA